MDSPKVALTSSTFCDESEDDSRVRFDCRTMRTHIPQQIPSTIRRSTELHLRSFHQIRRLTAIFPRANILRSWRSNYLLRR